MSFTQFKGVEARRARGRGGKKGVSSFLCVFGPLCPKSSSMEGWRGSE